MSGLDSCGISYELVLTKADEVKPSEMPDLRRRTLEAAITYGGSCVPRVLAVSAHSKCGLGLLRVDVLLAAGLMGEPERSA